MTDFERALAGEKSLREANLCGAILHGADLHGADLSCADLHGADLKGANLSSANLKGANLSSASLSGANLTGATLPEGIPAVPDLIVRLVEAVGPSGEHLDMGVWHHRCGTAHCLAGWTVTLSGEAGAALESRFDTNAAAALIWSASTDQPVPDWFASNEDALADLKKRVLERKATGKMNMDADIVEIVASIRQRDTWLAEHVAKIATGRNPEDKALALASAIWLFVGEHENDPKKSIFHDEDFKYSIFHAAHSAMLTFTKADFERIARRFAIECSALEMRASEVFDEPEFNEPGWWTQAQFVALNYHRLTMLKNALLFSSDYRPGEFPITRLDEVDDFCAPGFSASLGVAAPLWEPSEVLNRVNKNDPRAWWGAQGEPD